MIRSSLKSLFILGLTLCLACSIWAQEETYAENVYEPHLGVQGKSFSVTYSVDEEEYSEIITFEPDGSFSMAFFSQIEDSYGFYFDCLGILFYAHLSGAIVFDPFSFSFYGRYRNSTVFGISIIEFGGSKHISSFSGTVSTAIEEKM